MDLLFSVTPVHGPGVVTIVVDGDLDDVSAPQFTECVNAVADTPDRLVIDMGLVGFLDSAGMRALVAAQRRRTEPGASGAIADLTLTNLTRPARRALEIAGLLDHFDIE